MDLSIAVAKYDQKMTTNSGKEVTKRLTGILTTKSLVYTLLFCICMRDCTHKQTIPMQMSTLKRLYKNKGQRIFFICKSQRIVCLLLTLYC